MTSKRLAREAGALPHYWSLLTELVLIMPKCAVCQADCRGKHCRNCFNQKGKTKDTFHLHEISSSQNINLDETGFLPNVDGTLFSNPSFNNDGLLSDVMYTASPENNESGEVAAETFSLV